MVAFQGSESCVQLRVLLMTYHNELAIQRLLAINVERIELVSDS
jgi:hypothetical protein